MANDGPKSNVSNRLSLSSVAKSATVTRTLPRNTVALSDGNIAEIQPGIQGITVGSKVIYVVGGPGINSTFAKVIGHG